MQIPHYLHLICTLRYPLPLLSLRVTPAIFYTTLGELVEAKTQNDQHLQALMACTKASENTQSLLTASKGRLLRLESSMADCIVNKVSFTVKEILEPVILSLSIACCCLHLCWRMRSTVELSLCLKN